MTVPTKASGDRFVLSPREELAAGGSAEEFERRVKELFTSRYKHLVVDLTAVPFIDSAGVRAFVRAFTTAQRVGGTFTLAGPNARVRELLKAAHLDSVIPMVGSVKEAIARRRSWRRSMPFVAGGLFVVALVLAGWWIPQPAAVSGQWFPGQPAVDPAARMFGNFQPFLELFKLIVAAVIGMLVTRVQRSYRPERPQTLSLEHAQVLLCVSGAMMMIIIGDSVARAFGIAGAAAIIRFRTPVEDPKDITILFLLMGLGMASGLGSFGVAGLGTLFLCVLLAVLERVGARRTRAMMVEIEAEGREFPLAHVQGVFARNAVVFEPREVSQAKAVAVRYHTLLAVDQSLEDLSEQFMDGGRSAVKSVSWEVPKKTE